MRVGAHARPRLTYVFTLAGIGASSATVSFARCRSVLRERASYMACPAAATKTDS